MELKFLIDGQQYDNPNNWQEVSTAIEYDPVNQITTIDHNIQHEWSGDVYNLLYDRYLNNSLCNAFEVEVQGKPVNNWVTLFKGIILVTDCNFNERKRTVSVKILDDSYGARIENNKKAKIALDVTESKNGVALSITEAFETMFTPSDGVYLSDTCRGYYVHDAFEFLVKWMTDNKVNFRSDFFDPTLSNDGSLDWLVSGIDLRTAGEVVSAPKFSFQELFDVMRKLRNIAMGFQEVNGVSTVRIESMDFFRSNSNTVLLSEVNETQLSFEQSILYTTVKVGSDIVKKNDCSTACNASNNVSFFGFETEYYSLSGECTKEVELDLSVDDPFIVDTNKIQEVVEFNEDTYDEKTFIIKLASGVAQAEKSDPLGIGENWYNEAYTNKNVIERYQDYLSGTLNLFNLYSQYNLFLYEGNTPSSSLSPNQAPSYQNYPSTAGTGIPLNNLVYDPENSIDTGTERYYPVNDGVYQFCVGAAIDEFGSPPPAITVFWYLQIEHYDASNNLLATYQSDVRSYLTSASPNFEEWTSPYIAMDAGDYAIFNASYAQQGDPAVVGQATISIGGTTPDQQYFQCCNSFAAVQDAQVNTGLKRQVALTSFEYPIPFETYQAFAADTTQAIRITSKGIDRTGYINSISYNFTTGNAQIEILSNG